MMLMGVEIELFRSFIWDSFASSITTVPSNLFSSPVPQSDDFFVLLITTFSSFRFKLNDHILEVSTQILFTLSHSTVY